MKKILICSLGVLLASVTYADAGNIKAFIGGNVAANGVSWDKQAKDAADYEFGTDLATSNFGVGAEFGVKWASRSVYNTGFTFAYDYMADAEGDVRYYAQSIIDEFSTGFSATSLTWDNYIRLSGASAKRGDLVLGIGYASVKERVEIKTTPMAKVVYDLYDISAKESGGAVVVKIGYNGQLNPHLDWYLNGRWFAPKSKSDVDMLFNLSLGLRYNF